MASQAETPGTLQEGQPGPGRTAAPAAARTRRRAVAGIAVLAALLLLALMPPLINVNRLQRRIAASMSESLGRPVHLDRLTLHLLPTPGFTLENLVVSEDPRFGSEPVIRANVVEATLRPSSLWRRQVEFSTIRFVEPSLNLVRNRDGVWNLQSLLMHAAQVEAAPTAQQKAGPAPRFPYIEATNGRVNLKLAEEKQPLSLTDADFALWLPDPAEWRVRLTARPVRTDLNVADTGSVALEGSLQRAPSMAQVPVNLRAGWHDAPLGEASKLLAGHDSGWRGTLMMDATLNGPLANAKLAVSLHVNDLRRADFVAPRMLDLAVSCDGTLEAPSAVVREAACSLPEQHLNAVADRLNLSSLQAEGVLLGSPGMSESWLMDWARMFSQRIPRDESPSGTVQGSLSTASTAQAAWQGSVQGTVPGSPAEGRTGAAPESFTATVVRNALVLSPLSLAPPGRPPLTLSGTLSAQGYSLHLAGTASAQQLQSLAALALPLADDLSAAVPGLAQDSGRPEKLNVTCTRSWNAAQSCAAAPAEAPAARRARPHRPH